MPGFPKLKMPSLFSWVPHVILVQFHCPVTYKKDRELSIKKGLKRKESVEKGIGKGWGSMEMIWEKALRVGRKCLLRQP